MEDLVTRLRRWARRHERGSTERRLFHEAAEALESGGGLGEREVMAWLESRGITLVPWQEKRFYTPPTADTEEG